MSHCLTAMFYLYKRTEQWKLAKLTAIWSLKISLDFQNTFESLVTSYANVLLICIRPNCRNDLNYDDILLFLSQLFIWDFPKKYIGCKKRPLM